MRGRGRPGARWTAIAAIAVAAIAGPAALLAYAGVFESAESPGRAQTAAPAPTFAPRAPAQGGIPLGPPKLPTTLYGEVFTGTKVALTPETAVEELNAARSKAMRVFVILVGAQKHYKNEDGTFDLDSWKSVVDEFRDVDLGEFVVDRTIVAHQLVSEAKARAQWGGSVIPNNVLDEMARYSKEIWPTMPTMLRTDPSDLEEHAAAFGTPWPGWRWSYLDAASARYLTRKGSVQAFAKTEQASTTRQRLALVAGLNVLSGGDGSSEIGSPRAGAWAMSPDELLRYGKALLLGTSACAFELWRYESPGSAFENVVYFRRPEINEALRELAAIALQRPPRACRRQ